MNSRLRRRILPAFWRVPISSKNHKRTQGVPIAEQFSKIVGKDLATTIAEAGGNEVFFFGTLEAGVLVSIEPIARGDDRSVPVFLDRAAQHHVLIHNHPGGDLTPSKADLAIASEAGLQGLGFFIVNNSVTHVYRVVEPRPPEIPIDCDEVSEIFSAGGLLSRAIPKFEDREGQRSFAIRVAEMFNNRWVAACEAGTGVGKSFAYLVPAIFWAVRNNGRVVVSTQTIALSEQLVHKDLPLLKQTLNLPFRFSLAKGRGNYACKRKASELHHQRGLFKDDEIQDHWIEEILLRLKDSREGTRLEFDRLPPDDIWQEFQSTSEQSLKTKCPHYKSCFYYEARRHAAGAHIIVVNHHLLFSDLAIRRSTQNYEADMVLPAYKRVIFDEAHRLEEIAAQHLGTSLSRIGMLQSLGRISGPGKKKGSQRGRLIQVRSVLLQNLCGKAIEALDEELLPMISNVRGAVMETFESLEMRALGDQVNPGEQHGQILLRIGEREGELPLQKIEEPLLLLRDELVDLRRHIKRCHEFVLDEPFEPSDRFEGALAEFRSATHTVSAMIESLEVFFAPPAGLLSWIEFKAGRRANIILCAAPVRVSGILGNSLYERADSVVMTSATLSVTKKWDFLADRLGWSSISKDRFKGEIFNSPFDFSRQALLVLPSDLPEPNSHEFQRSFAELALQAILLADGRSFVLFTSHRMLRGVAAQIGPRLQAAGYPVLVQGEASSSELLQRFRSAGNAVLFGNQSFWEGVDIPGDALSAVIIAKLPFRVPSHPLERARAEDLEEQGLNSFSKLVVPQAALALKQGFGRLIRTTKDRGIVLIADRRLTEKSYGKSFLSSLPDARRVVGKWSDLRAEVASFFMDSDAVALKDENSPL